MVLTKSKAGDVCLLRDLKLIINIKIFRRRLRFIIGYSLFVALRINIARYCSFGVDSATTQLGSTSRPLQTSRKLLSLSQTMPTIGNRAGLATTNSGNWSWPLQTSRKPSSWSQAMQAIGIRAGLATTLPVSMSQQSRMQPKPSSWIQTMPAISIHA